MLDAFAGTGALGLEALSRGAAEAAVPRARPRRPGRLAGQHRRLPRRRHATVLAADALAPPPGRPCGLVFLDPPYGQDLVAPAP